MSNKPNIPEIPEQKNYENLTQFDLALIQRFPFIEEDFDAVNTYGIISKIKDYLNTTIKNEQTVTENQQNVYNSFVDLHNYVEDYFTNLDVQEEINNKLDEMVSSGVFASILNSLLAPTVNEINQRLDLQDDKISVIESGSPLVATSVSEMTNTSKVYVNTSDGKWYYYNGTNWVAGGTYQSTGIAENSITFNQLSRDVNSHITKFKLLSKEDERIKYGYITNNGTFNNASQRITDYLLLYAGSKIKVNDSSRSFRLAKYDLDRNFISVNNYNISTFYIEETGYYRIGEINKETSETVDAFYSLINIYNALGINEVYSELTGEKYFVDITGAGDYTSLMQCFEDLKDNTNKKTIYIKEGTYNIFEEIGGKEFCDSIPSNATDWREYSIMVPENTHLIGLGEVILNFLPESDEISSPAYNLLSCLNVQGNVEIENIKIYAKNCRYAIHDETSDYESFKNTTKIYRNVEAYKYVGSGYAQVFGCGFSDGIKFKFENCKFEHKGQGTPLSMHNRATGSNNIIFENCIFVNNSNSNSQVVFYNSSSNQLYNNVKLSNCYIKNRIGLGKNGSGSKTNSFKITANNCNNFGIYVDDGVTDNLTHENYNVIN